MDPTTVLLYLVSGFGLSGVGVATVVVSGSRAARRREARHDARRVAIEEARWEARTIIKHGKARVQLVRVARLGTDKWITEADDHFVDVPVGDSMRLLDAQADAELAAKTANGEDL
jgi:hypothetical protein